MVDFSRGLVAGFELVDRARARRDQRQLQRERISLARDADARAQGALDLQLRNEQREIERQAGTDRAAELLATAQTRDLDPDELQEMQSLASFDTRITPFLSQERERRRDVEAISSLSNIGTAPLGPQQQQQQQQQQQAAAPVTQSQGDQVSPLAVAAPQGTELPGAGPSSGTVPRSPEFMTTFLDKNLGVSLPEDLIDTDSQGQRFVNVPQEFMDEVAALEDIPNVVEREQRAKVLREQVTGLREQADFARQQSLMADTEITAWQAFTDPSDRGGSALRDLASSNPEMITNKLFNEWNMIGEQDPNLQPILAREMEPVVRESINRAGSILRGLPVNENGLVDMSSQEAQTAQRNFNQALEMQQQMSDSWTPQLEARIRANSMPVGNAELASELAGVVGDTPAAALPSDPRQRQANMTMAQNAVQQVASGRTRRLTTKQVESLAWLSKRGYITPGGFENFLATGSFSDPADFEFMNHPPDEMLIRAAPDGSTSIVYMPPNLTGVGSAEEQFSSEQMQAIKDSFPNPTGDARGDAMSARYRNEFIHTMATNADALGMRGMNIDQMSQMSPSELSLLALRYGALKELESEYENSWTAWLWGTPNTLTEKGINFSNFDEMARKWDVETPPLQNPNTDVGGARIGLLSSPDPFDIYQGLISSDAELEQAILEAQAEATNQ